LQLELIFRDEKREKRIEKDSQEEKRTTRISIPKNPIQQQKPPGEFRN